MLLLSVGVEEEKRDGLEGLWGEVGAWYLTDGADLLLGETLVVLRKEVFRVEICVLPPDTGEDGGW